MERGERTSITVYPQQYPPPPLSPSLPSLSLKVCTSTHSGTYFPAVVLSLRNLFGWKEGTFTFKQSAQLHLYKVRSYAAQFVLVIIYRKRFSYPVTNQRNSDTSWQLDIWEKQFFYLVCVRKYFQHIYLDSFKPLSLVIKQSHKHFTKVKLWTFSLKIFSITISVTLT